MPKNNAKILAIDPGTSKMGVALFDKGKLIYHGVKVIKGMKDPHEKLREGRRIVLRLVRDFRPKVLVLEKAFFARNRNVALLNVFVDEIRAIGRRKGITVISYAPSTVKRYICGNGLAGKKDVARVIVSRFPELKVYLTQDRAWKERHHLNMFDAVAIGLTAVETG
jgi:Holliday junction resolvasome RuvABC endonuclease subunit